MTQPEFYQDFMCRCSPEGEERCEEVIADATARLINDTEWGALDLFSAIVYDLQWSHDGFVDSIVADQWAGVTVVGMNNDGHYEGDSGPWIKPTVRATIFVQCDLPLDGLARAWQILADLREDEPTGSDPLSEDEPTGSDPLSED